MTPWEDRSREERALLNPGFCAQLIWHAARGYCCIRKSSISFEESFLILPLVLHRQTRESLPRLSTTSMAVWLEENPLARDRIAKSATILVRSTREGMLFGGINNLITIVEGRIHPRDSQATAVTRFLREASDEVRTCAKRSEFVGKWFAHTGTASTVLAVLGVRP